MYSLLNMRTTCAVRLILFMYHPNNILLRVHTCYEVYYEVILKILEVIRTYAALDCLSTIVIESNNRYKEGGRGRLIQ